MKRLILLLLILLFGGLIRAQEDIWHAIGLQIDEIRVLVQSNDIVGAQNSISYIVEQLSDDVVATCEHGLGVRGILQDAATTPDVESLQSLISSADVLLSYCADGNTGFITSNADWTPIEQDFDGVTMVMVPAGCFVMGSDDGERDEQPVHEVCFDEPFWLDKYEVTNLDYGEVGCDAYSSAPDQPRNCVEWFEANEYCQARDAYLPTEAQWEYAGRGPDNLMYPWGNEYDLTLAISGEDPTYGQTSTAPVGSIPDGASWVGAMDMSGNLWEWTSSLYMDYPYDETDGREQSTGDTFNVKRVVRGGAFRGTLPTEQMRLPNRDWALPSNPNNFYGFRCARS